MRLTSRLELGVGARRLDRPLKLSDSHYRSAKHPTRHARGQLDQIRKGLGSFWQEVHGLEHLSSQAAKSGGLARRIGELLLGLNCGEREGFFTECASFRSSPFMEIS